MKLTVGQVGGWLAAACARCAADGSGRAGAGRRCAFARIADEVSEGETHGVDRAVLMALRVPGDLSRPIGPPWPKVMAVDLTSLGSLAVLGLVVALVAGLFLAVRRWREALIVAVAAGGGLALSNALKVVFGRARPDAVFQVVPTINASFPSGHAMLSAVVFLTLGAMAAAVHRRRRRVRVYLMAAAVTLTVLVGVTRVYLEAHWPTDVLAGWSLGAAWASLCWLAEWAVDRWRRQGAGAAG